MMSIFTAALLALRSLFLPRILLILLFCCGLNFLLLTGLVAGFSALLHRVQWFGEWDWLADWGFTGIAVVMAFLLFPLLQPIIASLFITSIARAIEAADYPDTPISEPPFWPTLAQEVGFTLKAVGLNLLALPFYFIPVIGLILYYTLNGYLLGAEFFNAVAGRHIAHTDAQNLRSRYRLVITAGGAGITFCATIPVLNLISPVWGAALLVHVFHGIRRREATLLLEQKI